LYEIEKKSYRRVYFFATLSKIMNSQSAKYRCSKN
jgi:hypothetical protein